MRIGLIGHGPGSVNVLSVLNNPLKELNHDVISFPFTDYGLKCLGGSMYSTEYYLDIFTKKGLDLIIYGTGSLNEIEVDVSVLARHYGIYSVSILDALEPGTEKLRYFNRPDKVICLNNHLRNHILKETEMLSDDVLALGNPYLDIYKNYENIKYKPFKKENISLVYASEPCGSCTLNDTSDRSKKAILELIELLSIGILKDLVICVHPRESTSWISDTIQGIKGVRLGNSSTMTEVEDADLCLSLGSTIHYECMLKRIHSLKYVNKDSFLLSLLNYSEKYLDIEFGATKRIVNYINDLGQFIYKN